jgi:predicted Zn finger-like uncharacterized protein
MMVHAGLPTENKATMRIACPACDATYEVPDAMLRGGTRVVRCARCGNEWTPVEISTAPMPAEEPEAAPPPPSKPPPAVPPPDLDLPGRLEPRLKPLRPRPELRAIEPLPSLPAEPPRRGGAGAAAAWALSLLVLAGAAGAAVAWRTQVIAAWPPSERVFAALGLH